MKRSPQRIRRVRPNKPLWQYGQVRKRRSGRFGWLRKFPVKLVLILFVVFLAYEILTLPFLGVAQLSSKNPTQTALMEQRKAEANGKGTILRIDYRWVPLAQIPKHVRMAVLVAEDGAFFSHAGVDWHEVREALEDNWEEGRIVRGGSTITQQLAKNLYLSTSKDPIRKFKELLITWMLENSLTKKRILELYLNVIEWGPGVFGVEAAAQRYFHKPASQLTLNEGIRLAAVIPRPLRHRPTDDNDYVNTKTQWILKRMPNR
ncbi:MAG: monofunctional biosynthetic peptidoglycan transglycosylase [Nitrospirales bacterium]